MERPQQKTPLPSPTRGQATQGQKPRSLTWKFNVKNHYSHKAVTLKEAFREHPRAEGACPQEGALERGSPPQGWGLGLCGEGTVRPQLVGGASGLPGPVCVQAGNVLPEADRQTAAPWEVAPGATASRRACAPWLSPPRAPGSCEQQGNSRTRRRAGPGGNAGPYRQPRCARVGLRPASRRRPEQATEAGSGAEAGTSRGRPPPDPGPCSSARAGEVVTQS